MDPSETAAATAEAVGMIPARFMLDPATYEHGGELGFEGTTFYVAGRGGALGDVDGEVVAGAFVFLEPGGVVEAWDATRDTLPRSEAAREFAGCMHRWAANHLDGGIDWSRLADLVGRVTSAASPCGAPLFAAWRGMAEPSEPSALAVHRLDVLRELRGAHHAAAVIAAGLTPLEAMMVKTPFMAAIMGWPEPYPDAEPLRAAWDDAEAATDRALGRALEVLDAAERAELAELCRAAEASIDG